MTPAAPMARSPSAITSTSGDSVRAAPSSVTSVSPAVARRTVTKYRKILKIPSSRQRKDWTAPASQSGPSPGPD